MCKAWAELAVYLNLLCGILVFSIVVPKPVSVSGPFYHILSILTWSKQHHKIDSSDEMSFYSGHEKHVPCPIFIDVWIKTLVLSQVSMCNSISYILSCTLNYCTSLNTLSHLNELVFQFLTLFQVFRWVVSRIPWGETINPL